MSAPAPSLFSPTAKATAEQLGLSLGKPNLEVFSQTLLELAEKDAQIIAVTSDSRGSGKLLPFAKALPKQLVEVGIAEQNLVGIAAGLASVGKKVFAVSPACFLSARALEQVKNDIAYSDNPVSLVGISAGVSYGALGSTHHSLHDFAALRAINNIDIVSPADNYEARQAVTMTAELPHPVYLRFGKAPLYNLPQAEEFQYGKARVLRKGKDATFIATGETVIHALLAAVFLESKNIFCNVISVPSIKPLDSTSILQYTTKSKAVISVEEHMVNGGLGEACAALLAQTNTTAKFKIVGIPDEYTVTGSQADIFHHYGLSMEGLSQSMQILLES